MAARLDPHNVQATRQSLHHLVAKAPWSDEAVLDSVRGQVSPVMKKHGSVVAWIVDDIGFPKKGSHSVGVARQYCGQVGKQENCHVAVSLSVATWMRVCRWPIVCIYPRVGPRMPERRKGPGYPQGSSFKPSRRSRSLRFASSRGTGIPWIGTGRLRVRQRQRVSRRTHPTGTAVCGGGSEPADGLGTRQTPLPAKPRRKEGATSQTIAGTADHHPVTVKQFAPGLPSRGVQEHQLA